MLDVKAYVEQLNRLELDLLNKFFTNCKIDNKFAKDDLQYLLITIDKNKNIRFQAYLCVLKKV